MWLDAARFFMYWSLITYAIAMPGMLSKVFFILFPPLTIYIAFLMSKDLDTPTLKAYRTVGSATWFAAFNRKAVDRGLPCDFVKVKALIDKARFTRDIGILLIVAGRDSPVLVVIGLFLFLVIPPDLRNIRNHAAKGTLSELERSLK